MDKKNENVQKQEEQTKEVMSEIKEEYTKTADFLEGHTDQQLAIAKEMKEEMQNKDFDVNIEELKALKDEITGLKAEIKRLNEMENVGLSSLIVRDIKAVGNTLINLQEKAVGSIKHLYDNMKHQLSYNLTKAQEKFVQMKIGIVKGLVASMQDFIKEQQRKLDTCLEKLDNLSKEIQKDEAKLDKNTQNQEDKIVRQGADTQNKEEKQQEEHKGSITMSKEDKKEISLKGTSKEETVHTSTTNKKSKEQDKTEKMPKERNEKTAEKKPSVLKALKENQQKIRQEEQGKGEKIAKKDKGMEL
ncbi:MAG: conjugal transfer protein [Peptostreptococcaceae bacterium]|nr:conjugal transfer protein [Peptostreptococcaceae bacterium]